METSVSKETLLILYQTKFLDTPTVGWFKLIILKLDVGSYYINKYNFKLPS